MKTRPIHLLCALLFTFYHLHAQTSTPTLALGFIENKGQIQDQDGCPVSEVLYLLPLQNGLNVQLKKNGFSYDTYNKLQSAETFHFHRVDIELIGSNPSAIFAEAPASDALSYYNATTPETGIMQVRHFQKVIYKNIYPHIDLEFQALASKDKPVEYNFILQPGACVSDIRLRYKGPSHALLTADQLQLKLAHGNLTEHIPLSYWAESGIEEDIRYQILEPFAERQGIGSLVVGFTDPKQPIAQALVIDPVPRLDWGTYLGGDNTDSGRDMVLDTNGNVYVIGTSNSLNAIATAGAHQTTKLGDSDALIVKFNNDGVRQWSTYYGGSFNEFGQHIDLDAQGNIYIVGSTNSVDGIATAGAALTTLPGFNAAFIVKFNTDGVRQWGSYMGGSGIEFGNGIAVDAQGNAFIVGWTTSADGIATPGAHQTVPGGLDDVFLVKYNTNGARLWGTYFGGIGIELGLQVKMMPNGNVAIAGWTSTPAGMATAGAHQTTYGGGSADAFLAQFTTDGVRVWSSYYGGDADEYGDALAVDSDGNIYLGGPGSSASGLATLGSHQPAIGGGSDAFLAKFSSNGVRQWATYYGGNDDEAGYGIAIDRDNSVYLTGFTRSNNNIATADSHQAAFSGGDWDAFLVKFNSDGLREWGSYYGGTEGDRSYAIDVDADLQVFITGFTNSTNGISTPGAHQTTYGGGVSDVFVARFAPCPDIALNIPNGGYICRNLPFVMQLELSGGGPYTLLYTIDGVEQPPLTINNDLFFFTLEGNQWRDSVVFISVRSGDCVGEITGLPFARKVFPISNTEPVITCDVGASTYRVSFELQGGIFTPIPLNDAGFINGNVFTSRPIDINDDYFIQVRDGLRCDTITVSGSPNCVPCRPAGASASSNAPICEGERLQFNANGGTSYQWIGPNGFSSTEQNPSIDSASTTLHSGEYTVIIADANNCRDTIRLTPPINPLPELQVIFQPNICQGDTIRFRATGGGQSYVWTGPNGFSSTSAAPLVTTNARTVNSGIYRVEATGSNGCIAVASINIQVDTSATCRPPCTVPGVIASGNSPVCKGTAINLVGLGGQRYRWQGPNGFSSNQQNPSIPNATIGNNGIYTLTAFGENNCSTIVSINIVIEPAPIITASSSTDVACEGTTVNLNASGALTYAWSGPGGFNATTSSIELNNVNLNNAGNYIVIGTSANRCQASDTVSVSVNPRPTITANANTRNACPGETIELSASGGNSYVWTGPNGFNTTEPNPRLNNLNTTNTGRYTVVGTDTNGCSSTDTITLTIGTLPNVSIQVNSPICEGDAIQLMANGAANYSYTWSGPEGFSSTAQNPVINSVSKAYAGTYTVEINDGNNCSSILSTNVEVAEKPRAIITGPSNICAGLSATLSASGGSTFTWNTGVTAPSISVSPTTNTTYRVVVANGLCRDTASFNLNLTPLPTLRIDGGGTTIRRRESADLFVSGADTYSWLPDEGLSCNDCPNPTAAPLRTTKYCVTGTLDGCTSTICTNIIVDNRCPVYTANVFSPNGDGINDEWCALSNCLENITLRIFDRWGNLLFSATSNNPCWDGRVNNTLAPIGVYIFTIEANVLNDDTIFRKSGDIMLVR